MFGGQTFKLCEDVYLTTQKNVVSSQDENYYYGLVSDDDTELCANPFEFGELSENEIKMQTSEGYPVKIIGQLFAVWC